MTKTKKATRSVSELSSLDSFLKEEGKLEELEAVAIKERLAQQFIQPPKAQKPNQK